MSGTFVPNNFSCPDFYQCVDGTPITRQCREGLWFSFNQQRCTEPFNSGCILDESICEGLPSNFKFRSNTRCSDYIHCYNHFPVPLTCWDNMWFNENSQQCEDPEKVECEIDNSTTESSNTFCNGVPDYLLTRKPGYCDLFYVCVFNEPTMELKCPDGQYFDEKLQTCNDKNFVECN